MLANLIADFLVPQIPRDPEALICKGFPDIPGPIGLGVGDIHHHRLHRARQAGRVPAECSIRKAEKPPIEPTNALCRIAGFRFWPFSSTYLAPRRPGILKIAFIVPRRPVPPTA